MIKKILNLSILLTLTFFSAISCNAQDFDIPDHFYKYGDTELPTLYLSNIYVDDVENELSYKQKRKIKFLFIAASASTYGKFQQDYLIDKETPILKLLLFNFPDVENKLNFESGKVAKLSEIADLLEESYVNSFKNQDIKKSEGQAR